VSKIYSRLSNRLSGFALFLALSGCAISPQAPSSTLSRKPAISQEEQASSSSSTQPVEKKDPTQSRSGESPHALASLRLTEQARALLDSGKPDDAITTLERAVNLSPSNGQNYYYLAEAWLGKGIPSQAREFNRLASIYLKDEPDWMDRVKAQEERIKKRL
jgi:tetratricopeptide (TPR) repeat protein